MVRKLHVASFTKLFKGIFKLDLILDRNVESAGNSLSQRGRNDGRSSDKSRIDAGQIELLVRI